MKIFEYFNVELPQAFSTVDSTVNKVRQFGLMEKLLALLLFKMQLKNDKKKEMATYR